MSKLARPLVLDVGQCDFDHAAISRLIRSCDALALRASTAEQARQLIAAHNPSLVLVNRIFDADGDSGLAFLDTLRSQFPTLKFLLVSNYEEAQAQAQEKGALPGFGKNSVRDSSVQSLISSYLK